MADRLDAVNASFEDCEEQDDDVEIMQTEGLIWMRLRKRL